MCRDYAGHVIVLFHGETQSVALVKSDSSAYALYTLLFNGFESFRNTFPNGHKLLNSSVYHTCIQEHSDD